MSVVIIDYEMGNVSSVQKTLNFLKIENEISNNHDTIKKADAIVLPGVGSFRQGMENLNRLNLVNLIKDEVLVKKKKFLGICLGMQLVMKIGTENGITEGLGFFPGEVIRLNKKDLIIPHLGWNNIKIIDKKLYSGVLKKDFYFIHSYHVVPKDFSIVSATVNYGSDIVASLTSENICATQFHPEKSQESGLTLLTNFLNNA
jgi:imidazole glycerol-phosphate synthase subunit HisH